MRSKLLDADVHEFRRSRRFPIEAPLRYRVSCEAAWQKAQTENISSTGVLFRCEQCAECGALVEMNFLLLRTPNDQAGLEVACKGEIVRLDLPLGGGKLPALAVNITGYWLCPGSSGRWDFDESFRKSGTEE